MSISILQSFSERNKTPKSFTSLIANMECRWSIRRLESAAVVVVNVLLENKAEKFSRCGMSRIEVKDAARKQIGDTGLLGYVLKSTDNVIVGDYIMCHAVNPSTRLLEYTIHELVNGEELEAFDPGADVSSDVVYLCRNVPLNYLRSKLVGGESQVVLNNKHFVKEWTEWWPFKDEQDQDECGAEDDDGERMVASDIGEVWQHTRCRGIQDLERGPGAESEFGDGSEVLLRMMLRCFCGSFCFTL